MFLCPKSLQWWMVRFYDEEKSKITDALLDVIEVDDASAEGLYKSVKELLKQKEIPYKTS